MENSEIQKNNELTTTEQTVDAVKDETTTNPTVEEKNETTTSTEEEKNEIDTTQINETETETEVKTEEKTEKPKGEWGCEYLDEEFIKDVMSIPTVSKEEYRMVSFIILWARRNNVKYEFDTYGNVYLTKGEIAEGEFYPCVTSHLDTVQDKQRVYAQSASPLQLKTRIKSNKHELYVDGMGIGADDKAGVLISLSLFKYFDKIKACFFLEEEIGMCGSKALNASWFENVGYVIGWDSPDLNRAAWASNGVTLFSKSFFEDEIRDVCKEWGLTSFRSEPFTDVAQIRQKTNVICMNFGNGGYNAHMPTEYIIVEDVDHATGMGKALIEKLGTREFKLEHKEHSYQWIKQADGTYKKPKEDLNYEYFNKLEHPSTYGGGSSNYGGSHYGYYDDDEWDDYYGNGYTRKSATTPTTTPTTTPATTTSTAKNDGKTVDAETVKYVVEQYDEHIDDIKLKVKEKCDELGIDFANFKEIFDFKIEF